MHVRFMQLVDYWLGVPLCFLTSCFERLRAVFFGKEQVQQPKGILFVELSEMGSAILAYSSIYQAKKRHPDAELYFLIFAKNSESCELLDLIPDGNILRIDDRNFLRFAISTLKILIRIRSLKIDTAIDLELFSRCTSLISYLSGAKIRVGFDRFTNEGLYRGNFITHPVPYNPHLHIALNFLALVAALDAPKDQIPLVKSDLSTELMPLPQIQFSGEELKEIRAILRAAHPNIASTAKFVIVNPDPGDMLPIRGWPLDRFVSVSQKVLDQNHDSLIVVIGLKRSKPYAQALQAALGEDRCIDLTGKTPTLRSVISLFSISKLLITNDSGPVHLSSLSSIKTVALFGPETPKLYGPLSPNAESLFASYACSPCLSATNHRHTRCNDNRCLKAISVDDVMGAVNRALGNVEVSKRSEALRIVNF